MRSMNVCAQAYTMCFVPPGAVRLDGCLIAVGLACESETFMRRQRSGVRHAWGYVTFREVMPGSSGCWLNCRHASASSYDLGCVDHRHIADT